MPHFTSGEWRRNFHLSILPLGLLLLSVAPALGQPQDATAAPEKAALDSVMATIERGVQAVEHKQYDNAYALLAPLTTNWDSLHHPTHGTPARWLGRAFYEQGRPRQARIVWANEVRRAQNASHTAVGVADALIRSMNESSDPTLAVLGFDHILDAFGLPVSEAEEEVLRRHAAQLALITPDAIAEPLSALAKGHRSPSEVSVGPELRQWFRRQDPILATEENERLREHVVRIHTAHERYGWDQRTSGLDDRGEIYVRLGPPPRTESVTLQGTPDLDVRHSLTMPSKPDINRGLLISDNEVWVYSGLSPSTHFLFVKQRKPEDPYLISRAQELLDPSLQVPPPVKTRGRSDEWRTHMNVRLSIYGQLMRFDAEYARRYNKYTTYLSKYEAGLASFPPDLFVQQEMAYNENASDWLVEDRKEKTPKQQTQAQADVPSLPVAVQTARFLNEDGTTRTEIYWSAPTDSLVPSDDWIRTALERGQDPSGNYLLKTTGVLHTSSAPPTVKARSTDTISVGSITGHDRLPTRSLVLDSTTSHGQLSLEWIQNILTRQDSTGTLLHVTRKDEATRALPSTRSELVMSDLRLLHVPAEGPAVPSSAAEARRRVIPFDRIPANQKIAINFELYNLILGADDRTRYTVEYSTERRKGQGGLAGLLGRTEAEETSTESTIEGTKRRTTEYTVLDLSEMSSISEPRPVTITVRATDERTGQTVERSLSFTLVPAEK